MINENYVQHYAKSFNYKKVEQLQNKSMYIKETSKGFVVIESEKYSKYVNFFLNEDQKIFKKSDLLLGIIDETAIAWEVECE